MAERTFGQRFTRSFIGLAAFFGGIWLLALAITPTEEEIAAREAQERAELEAKIEADPTYGSRVACMDAIRKNLVSPSSAEFGDWSEWSAWETEAGGPIRVTATFEASNALGVMLRQTWVCDVERRGDYWYLVDLREG
jgi:hypothetical protein